MLDVDVQDIDCDFYAFTGHKLYGPTGIGVLYGKYEHLDAMPPFNGGGEMIREVFEDRVTYGDPPHKFEAGTPSIVQAIGLGAALDYVASVGKARIRAHEAGLVHYAHDRLREINSLRIFGTTKDKGADRLVRDEGRASARRGDDHRPLGRGGARRHPLRHAASGALRRDGELPRLVCHVQYARRGRLPGAGADQGAGDFRMIDEPKPSTSAARRAWRAPPAAGRATRIEPSAIPADEMARLTDEIVGALKTVYDPEIPGRHLRARPDLQGRYRRRPRRSRST